MIIDTHSHLSFKAYDEDRDKVIKRTQENGIICIDVGTKFETSQKAVELADNNSGIFATVGLHPFHIKTDLLKIKTNEDEGNFQTLGEEFDIKKYKELVYPHTKVSAETSGVGARLKKVVAIGEIGLDYYYKPKTKARLEQFKEKQKQVFLQQLDLARELNLPVILHCRMAHEDLLKILGDQIVPPQRDPAEGGTVSYKEIKGVIHCFTGGIKELEQYLNLGFYIGFNGIIFSALGGSASGGKLPLDEVIKKCPLDKILVETDCPYLTPPKEGKDNRNEPVFIKHIIQKIADLKGISFNEVAQKTTQNAQELFKI